MDNSLLTAGLLYETKFFVNRINNLMENSMDVMMANKLDDGSVTAERAEDAKEQDADSILKETIANFKSKSEGNMGVGEGEIKFDGQGKPIV